MRFYAPNDAGPSALVMPSPSPLPYGRAVRDLFMIEEGLTTFNFGGFGGLPLPVFEAQLGYMRMMGTSRP